MNLQGEILERGTVAHNTSTLGELAARIEQHVESFNGKFRDELLNRELFLSIDELRYVVNRGRMDYNHYRPHSSLGYMAPAAFVKLCLDQVSAMLRLAQDREHSREILS